MTYNHADLVKRAAVRNAGRNGDATPYAAYMAAYRRRNFGSGCIDPGLRPGSHRVAARLVIPSSAAAVSG